MTTAVTVEESWAFKDQQEDLEARWEWGLEGVFGIRTYLILPYLTGEKLRVLRERRRGK